MYVGAKDPSDTITLTGHPNISLTIPGGSHGDIATASVVVNSIPVILDAPAGLRTSRDLPIGFFSPNAKPSTNGNGNWKTEIENQQRTTKAASSLTLSRA